MAGIYTISWKIAAAFGNIWSRGSAQMHQGTRKAVKNFINISEECNLSERVSPWPQEESRLSCKIVGSSEKC